MPTVAAENDLEYILRFGGGVHSAKEENKINPIECDEGVNFDLDLDNQELKNRPFFDLVATAPNAGRIRGFVTLKDSDGTVTMLVQADGNVYSWNGSTFSLVGTVDTSANLRGRIEHYWQLDDLVLITDMSLQDVVMTWDGTTLADMSHDLTGTFLAKYLFVADERVWYGNVISNGTATPHLVVGSGISDYNDLITVTGDLSAASRPSTSLTEGDPFFMHTPDLRAINGLVQALGVIAISTEEGNIHKVTGTTAKDFALASLFSGSGAAGDEAMVYAGSDILYGREGRLESLTGSERFGDIENDDLSRWIKPDIKTYKDWLLSYNRRLQRGYCHPVGESQIWMLNPALIAENISPWSKWTTAHAMAFNPTAMMNMYDPSDGLEYTFLGDANGNIYRLEGTSAGDAGGISSSVSRLSQMIQLPADMTSFDYEGYIQYRKPTADVTVTITFEYSGYSAFEEAITLTLSKDDGGWHWGGNYYFGGSIYWGSRFAGKLTRQRFGVPGGGELVQMRVTIDGTTDFVVNEIGIKFDAASQ